MQDVQAKGLAPAAHCRWRRLRDLGTRAHPPPARPAGGLDGASSPAPPRFVTDLAHLPALPARLPGPRCTLGPALGPPWSLLPAQRLPTPAAASQASGRPALAADPPQGSAPRPYALLSPRLPHITAQHEVPRHRAAGEVTRVGGSPLTARSNPPLAPCASLDLSRRLVKLPGCIAAAQERPRRHSWGSGGAGDAGAGGSGWPSAPPLASLAAPCRRINSFLDSVDVGDLIVKGDLEAYSCEAAAALFGCTAVQLCGGVDPRGCHAALRACWAAAWCRARRPPLSRAASTHVQASWLGWTRS